MFDGDIGPVRFEEVDDGSDSAEDSSDSDLDDQSRKNNNINVKRGHSTQTGKSTSLSSGENRVKSAKPIKYPQQLVMPEVGHSRHWSRSTSPSPASRPRSASASNIVQPGSQQLDKYNAKLPANYTKDASAFNKVRHGKLVGIPSEKDVHLHTLAPPKVDNGRPKSPTFRRRQYKMDVQQQSSDSLYVPGQIEQPTNVITRSKSPLLARRCVPGVESLPSRPISPRPMARGKPEDRHDVIRPTTACPSPRSNGNLSRASAQKAIEITISEFDSLPETNRPRSCSFSIGDKVRRGFPSIVYSPSHTVHAQSANHRQIDNRRVSLSVGAGSSLFKDIFKQMGGDVVGIKKVEITGTTTEESKQDETSNDETVCSLACETVGVKQPDSSSSSSSSSPSHNESPTCTSLQDESRPTNTDMTRRRSVSFGAKTTRVNELRQLRHSHNHCSDGNVSDTDISNIQNERRFSISDEQIYVSTNKPYSLSKMAKQQNSSLRSDQVTSNIPTNTKKLNKDSDIKDEEYTTEELLPLESEPYWTKTNILKQSHRASIADASQIERKFTSKYPVYHLENPECQTPNVFVIVHDDDLDKSKD